MSVTADEVKKKVEDLSNLPTLPHVVQLVSTMVEDEQTSAQEVGNVIAKDQVLSAKILRLVNSPIYGFPGRISSITHALVLLGFSVVKGLVLTAAVFDNLARSTRGLWEHSLGTAVLSRRLAKELKLRDPEEIMVAGLLHDLGKVVLSYIYPEETEAAQRLARLKGVHIALAERDIFGVDHTRVAAWLAWHWHLPARLTDALAYHHLASRAQNAPEATAVVHLADILARGMGYGDPGDDSMPTLDHKAFQSLGLSYPQIDAVLTESEVEYASGVNILRERGA